MEVLDDGALVALEGALGGVGVVGVVRGLRGGGGRGGRGAAGEEVGLEDLEAAAHRHVARSLLLRQRPFLLLPLLPRAPRAVLARRGDAPPGAVRAVVRLPVQRGGVVVRHVPRGDPQPLALGLGPRVAAVLGGDEHARGVAVPRLVGVPEARVERPLAADPRLRRPRALERLHLRGLVERVVGVDLQPAQVGDADGDRAPPVAKRVLEAQLALALRRVLVPGGARRRLFLFERLHVRRPRAPHGGAAALLEVEFRRDAGRAGVLRRGQDAPRVARPPAAEERPRRPVARREARERRAVPRALDRERRGLLGARAARYRTLERAQPRLRDGRRPRRGDVVEETAHVLGPTQLRRLLRVAGLAHGRRRGAGPADRRRARLVPSTGHHVSHSGSLSCGSYGLWLLRTDGRRRAKRWRCRAPAVCTFPLGHMSLGFCRPRAPPRPILRYSVPVSFRL